MGLCTSRGTRAGRLEWKGRAESVARRNNEDRRAQRGMVRPEASRWSVAMESGRGCVRWQADCRWVKDATGLASETRFAASAGGDCEQSGQGNKHGGRADGYERCECGVQSSESREMRAGRA